jgi:hypothetical protein
MKFSMLYGTIDIIFSTRNELLEAGNEKEKQFVCELFIVSGIGFFLSLEILFFRLFIASGIRNFD